MDEIFGADENEETFIRFITGLPLGERVFWLQSDLLAAYEKFCDTTGRKSDPDPVLIIVRGLQEGVVYGESMLLSLRPHVGRWSYLKVSLAGGAVSQVDVAEFLAHKERMVNGESPFPLEIDLGPFNRGFPRLHETRSIGRGGEFLNRKLSSEIFHELDSGGENIFRFLSVHQYRGTQLMLNQRVDSVAHLRRALRRAEEFLSTTDPTASWETVADKMRPIGFEPGWGKDVTRMRQTLTLLSGILEAPDPDGLEKFLGVIPMIFSIAVITPHGYFGQENVLGRPDTGGQVVYILDQVRALEAQMRHRLVEQGLDIEPNIVIVTRLLPEADGTDCDQRIEKVKGTRSAVILRVPFRRADGEVVPHWISRFEVWPYLERFADDVRHELVELLDGRPDLIIGNYSDGSLVASLLARKLHVTQCNIAHALEKTKYLYSDLYWRENEERYHFSCQFTADLIAMNYADFIVTSTYQEIAGRADSVGQYESYRSFTMPGLYRVVDGVDVFDPKFNIVSPGADPNVYYSFRKKNRRLRRHHPEIDDLLFGPAGRADTRGELADPDKPPLFTMARFDRIKNVTGFVRWYAESPELRERCNLVLVGGKTDPAQSGDQEEAEQIETMHRMMDDYGLDGSVRWLGMHLEKRFAGELYRRIGDRKGAFVQPALFEAFGLTVIEAMVTGLPTFATCYGGPLEIIEDNVSGFHINPNFGDQAVASITAFYDRVAVDPSEWDRISTGGERRVAARYTWERYAERLMTLARVYGFWKFVTNLERDETRRYLEALFTLQYRPLAAALER